jgi:hypothetical protein
MPIVVFYKKSALSTDALSIRNQVLQKAKKAAERARKTQQRRKAAGAARRRPEYGHILFLGTANP